MFYKLEENIDNIDILKELEKNDYLWKFNTNRQDKLQVQSETLSISLRRAKNVPEIPTHDQHDTIDTNLYVFFPKIKKFIDHFLYTYGGELGRAMIVKLPANKQVYPHHDYGKYYQERDRFHFIIKGKYEYIVENQSEIFNEKELWWFDNNLIHSAKTIGNIDRICLIFDVKNSKWRDHFSKDK